LSQALRGMQFTRVCAVLDSERKALWGQSRDDLRDPLTQQDETRFDQEAADQHMEALAAEQIEGRISVAAKRAYFLDAQEQQNATMSVSKNRSIALARKVAGYAATRGDVIAAADRITGDRVTVLQTVSRIVENAHKDIKYSSVKSSSKVLKEKVLNLGGGPLLMAAGFTNRGETWELSSEASAEHMQTLLDLLEAAQQHTKAAGSLTMVAAGLTKAQVEAAAKKSLAAHFGVAEDMLTASVTESRRLGMDGSGRLLAGTWTIAYELYVSPGQVESVSAKVIAAAGKPHVFNQAMATQFKTHLKAAGVGATVLAKHVQTRLDLLEVAQQTLDLLGVAQQTTSSEVMQEELLMVCRQNDQNRPLITRSANRPNVQ